MRKRKDRLSEGMRVKVNAGIGYKGRITELYPKTLDTPKGPIRVREKDQDKYVAVRLDAMSPDEGDLLYETKIIVPCR